MNYASIIICHYGLLDDFGEKSGGKNPKKRSDLVRNLLKSIEENTEYPVEVIMCDNGGNPDDTDYFVEKVREGTINTLIRTKENRHFAMAWNQGAKLATGDYLVFLCNDIEITKKGWLKECIKVLEDYPDRQWCGCGFITYDKLKKTEEVTPEGYRVNHRSGSNCLIVRKEDWPKLGEWPVHRIGGSKWFTKNFREGWRFTAPPENVARDAGWRSGVNFSIPIEVKKTLLNGADINFEEPNQ